MAPGGGKFPRKFGPGGAKVWGGQISWDTGCIKTSLTLTMINVNHCS